MFCGLSLSGKTFLANKIVDKYPNMFFPMDSRSIHTYLNQFEVFKDDNSIKGKSYEMREKMTNAFQKDIINIISEYGHSIMHDSCNRKVEERESTFKLVKSINPDVKTLLVYVNPEREIIKSRAIEEDKQLIKKGNKAVWEELFNKQVESFDVPDSSETDFFFESDGNNVDELLGYLGNILSK